MRSKTTRTVGIVAGVLLLASLSGPVSAGTTSITDATGIDYDPSCVLATSITPYAPNWNHGAGCAGVTTSDGSATAYDLTNTSLSSDASGHLVASTTINGSVPPAGSTNRAGFDISDGIFDGTTYYVLFQNKTMETNAAYTACPPAPPRWTPVLQRWGAWQDGYHFFVSFSVNWDSTKWVHIAQMGEYNPNPGGGYRSWDLGVNDGSGWRNVNPYHSVGTGAGQFNVSISGSTVTVTAPGVYEEPDTTNCSNGHFDYWFAKAGDNIANVKGLTTANWVVTLPTTIPLGVTCGFTDGLVCLHDITSKGAFFTVHDTTDGKSVPGSTATGDLLATPCYNESPFGNVPCIAYTDGAGGTALDTLAPGPTCPTFTLGGMWPQNPLFNPGQPCLIDQEGTAEFWDTTHGFVF